MRAPCDRPLRDAIAAVTWWLDDERDAGTRIAASAVDRDAVAFLDALGGLVTVLHDVCAVDRVDLAAIVRDVALGVAQAGCEADGSRPSERGHDGHGPDGHPGRGHGGGHGGGAPGGAT